MPKLVPPNKRTKGPLLIELAYNAITLPIISFVPEIEPTETPGIFIQPPSVIQFQNIIPVGTNAITFDNLDSMHRFIYTLNNFPPTEDLHDKYFNSMPTLNSYSRDLAN